MCRIFVFDLQKSTKNTGDVHSCTYVQREREDYYENLLDLLECAYVCLLRKGVCVNGPNQIYSTNPASSMWNDSEITIINSSEFATYIHMHTKHHCNTKEIVIWRRSINVNFELDLDARWSSPSLFCAPCTDTAAYTQRITTWWFVLDSYKFLTHV